MVSNVFLATSLDLFWKWHKYCSHMSWRVVLFQMWLPAAKSPVCPHEQDYSSLLLWPCCVADVWFCLTKADNGTVLNLSEFCTLDSMWLRADYNGRSAKPHSMCEEVIECINTPAVSAVKDSLSLKRNRKDSSFWHLFNTTPEDEGGS